MVVSSNLGHHFLPLLSNHRLTRDDAYTSSTVFVAGLYLALYGKSSTVNQIRDFPADNTRLYRVTSPDIFVPGGPLRPVKADPWLPAVSRWKGLYYRNQSQAGTENLAGLAISDIGMGLHWLAHFFLQIERNGASEVFGTDSMDRLHKMCKSSNTKFSWWSPEPANPCWHSQGYTLRGHRRQVLPFPFPLFIY